MPATPTSDEELRVLRRLVALAGPLNAELNLPALLGLVLDTAIEATGAERGLVIHVDASQKARVQSARNFGGTPAEERDLAYSRTVVQEVVKTGRPRTSADAMDDAEARRVLENWEYPQNVRELENAVRAAVAYCEGTVIGLEDLPPKFREAGKDVRIRVPRTNDELKEALGQAQADLEKAFIVESVRRAGGIVSKASTETGMNRALMQRKMKEYGVSARDFRRPGESAPADEEE